MFGCVKKTFLVEMIIFNFNPSNVNSLEYKSKIKSVK